MEIRSILEAPNWAMPFHFWSVVFFTLGLIVGSFLNVCIHRLPLGESVISPPSHCPHCRYSIPWYLNIPLVTWVCLRGKCANCGARISVRYFLVELLTGIAFLGCWLTFGHRSAPLALAGCLFLAGLIVATFIDFDLLIIPDEITIGGMVAGVICSFLVPALHRKTTPAAGIWDSMVGMAAGAGVMYAILRAGKLGFGRQTVRLPAAAQVVFTDTAIVLPGQVFHYEELFYRRSDAVKLEATRVELSDRCYRDVPVRLTSSQLRIGDERMDPESVPYMEVTTDKLVLPREAMGLGDVKFMAAIGAFLGWQAVLFSIFCSAVIGAAIGVLLILLGKKSLQSRLPYGPYIAAAAALWLFGAHRWWAAFWSWGLR
jgi:leader peptidase (prepilin peptidase) / N-methyltransferase